MAGTLAAIIGLSTLVFTLVLSLVGLFDLVTLGILVVAFNIFQWLISPYIIDALYSVKEIPEHENPKLHEVVENLSRKSGIKKPRLMLARIPIPNAFAYGSPIAGNRVPAAHRRRPGHTVPATRIRFRDLSLTLHPTLPVIRAVFFASDDRPCGGNR